MKKISRLIALIMVAVFMLIFFPIQSSAANVTTVTVGASGCNFTSISDALSKYSSDVVINVKAGTYNEQLKITGDNVTINCENGVVLSGAAMDVYYLNGNYYDRNRHDSRGNDVKCSSDMLRITGSNITINGLEVAYLECNSKSIDPTGIAIRENASHVTIANCKVHDIACTNASGYNAHGINVKAHGSNEISDVTVTGCEVYNLTLGSSESVVFNGKVTTIECSNNYIHDNDNIGIDFAGYYEGDGSEANRAHDIECFGNVVVNCSSVKNGAYGYCAGCDGIYVDGGYDARIHDNYVKGCDIGVEVSSEILGKCANDVQVYNNIVAESNLYGISIGGCEVDENGYTIGCEIKNNTVYSKGYVPCFNVQNASSASNIITNNLFINNEEDCISFGNGYDNTGNMIKNNTELHKATVVCDVTNRTIAVSTSEAVKYTGAANTIINGQAAAPTVAPTTTPATDGSQPYATITVDQHKSDWENIPTANSEFIQYVRGAKIEYVKVCYNDTYDYLLFNASSFGSGYQIYIDADNDGETGYDGYDYLIENDRLYVSTGTGWNWQRLTPSESDFTLARRETSRHFVEVRFNRAAMNMTTVYSYDVVLLDASFNVTYEASGSVN